MRRLALVHSLIGLALVTGAPLATAARIVPVVPPDTLRAVVRADRHPDLRWPVLSDVGPGLDSLYVDAEWTLLWLAGARPTDATKALVRRLAAADSLGLDPADYDAAWLAQMIDEFAHAKVPPPAGQQARFDVALSVAALRFVTALACGRVDPLLLGGEYDIPRACPPADSLVMELRDAERQAAVLREAQPRFRHYQLLKNGLVRYRALARDTTLVPLPAIPADLRPGGTLSAAPALRRLLRAVGDYPGKKTPKAKADTVYTPELAEAVKRFQARHGFLPDGVLWSQTIDRLNRPFAERVRQIELALERWRWLPSTFDVPPVIVNIPAFRLYAYRALSDRGDDMLAMDVLVGAAVKSETPVFRAQMTHVIFRPFWEIPADIMNFELGPRALQDRENMERLGYVLVSANDADTTTYPLTPANLKRIGRDLRMRQRPGSGNALGLVKFMLPNPHDIYLHDTPAPGLFVLPRRDFSHGCIRVEDPVALAVHVLRDQPEWTAERVKEAMESGEDNVRVDLATPVPVFIVYATADGGERGDVHFYTDIYDLDGKLDALLRKGYPYPRSAAERGRRGATQGRISTGVPTGTTR